MKVIKDVVNNKNINMIKMFILLGKHISIHKWEELFLDIEFNIESQIPTFVNHDISHYVFAEKNERNMTYDVNFFVY